MRLSAVLWPQLRAAATCALLAAALAAAAAAGARALWASPLRAAALGSWAAAELAFLCFYFGVLARDHTRQPDGRHMPPDYDPAPVVRSFLKHMRRVADVKAYLSAWFLDAPFEHIRLGNVEELVAYALYYRTMDQMRQEGLVGQLDALLEQLQEMHSVRLPPGRNPAIRFMSHLWDEVPHVYRPLAFYLCMEVAELLCMAMLLLHGFSRHELGGCVYWTKGLPPPHEAAAAGRGAQERERQTGQTGQEQTGQQQSREHQQGSDAAEEQRGEGNNTGGEGQESLWPVVPPALEEKQALSSLLPPVSERAEQQQGNQRQRCQGQGQGQQQQQQGQQQQQPGCAGEVAPLVLLHGVGAGLLPYVGFIFVLASTTGRPVLLPVWKHVSMRLTRTIPTVDDAADVTLAALARHGASRAVFVAHSYGTCVAARIVKRRRDTVEALALIDPVCFMMFMPVLLKYFLYAPHTSGHWLADLILPVLSSELHCATVFCRKFFWTSINLFDEHLPERALVALSGNDLLCPAVHVRSWLESSHVRVLYNPTAAHGAGLLFTPEWQRTIVTSLLELLQQGGKAEQAAEAAAEAQALALADGAGAADEDVRRELSPAESDVGRAAAAAPAVVAAAAAERPAAAEEALPRHRDYEGDEGDEEEDGAGRESNVDGAAGVWWPVDAVNSGLLDAGAEIDALWESTSSFVAGWVSVLRVSPALQLKAAGGLGPLAPGGPTSCAVDATLAGRACDQRSGALRCQGVQG